MNTKSYDNVYLVWCAVLWIAIVIMAASMANSIYSEKYGEEKSSYTLVQDMGWEVTDCFYYGEYRPDWKSLFGTSPWNYMFAGVMYRATEKVWESEGKFFVEKTDDGYTRICPNNSSLTY